MFKSVLLTILLSTLVACGGSDPSIPENSNDDRVVDSGNNDSDSGDDNADSTGIPMTALDAARLLNQATYGATLSEIEDITGQTREHRLQPTQFSSMMCGIRLSAFKPMA